MDGNNSLKRLKPFGDRTAADTRVLESDYIIPREYVDRFADEGKKKARGPQVHVEQETADTTRAEQSYLVDEDIDLVDVSQSDGAPNPGQGLAVDDQAEAAATTPDAEPSQGHDGCTANWKAAADDSKKTMWGIFDETGIFSCACRHGFWLWTADMVRSGEL